MYANHVLQLSSRIIKIQIKIMKIQIKFLWHFGGCTYLFSGTEFYWD